MITPAGEISFFEEQAIRQGRIKLAALMGRKNWSSGAEARAFRS